MSTITKIQKKGQVVIPRSLRERAGVSEGDFFEVKVYPKQRREEFVRRVKDSAPQALKNIWEESKRKGLDKLTMRQIDAIISEVRQEQNSGKTAKQPAK